MSNDGDMTAKFEELGLIPTSAPRELSTVDLDTLREELEASIRHERRTEIVLSPGVVLAVIDRAKTAESFTNVYPCWTQVNFSTGVWWCLLHDTAFALDEGCEFSGKSVLEQLNETLASERASGSIATERLSAAETKLAALDELVSDWESLQGIGFHKLQALRATLQGRKP